MMGLGMLLSLSHCSEPYSAMEKELMAKPWRLYHIYQAEGAGFRDISDHNLEMAQITYTFLEDHQLKIEEQGFAERVLPSWNLQANALKIYMDQQNFLFLEVKKLDKDSLKLWNNQEGQMLVFISAESIQ